MRIEHRSIFVSAMAALGLGLALFSAGCGKEAQTAVSGQPPPPPEVAVHVVEPRSVALTTELPGRTSAYLVAEVRPQVGGIVLKRLFTEGSDVKAGQVLYEIDPSSYQAAYANATAALARAKAAHASAKAASSRAKAAYSNAVAARTGAGANLANVKAASSKATAGQAGARAGYTGAKTSQAAARAALARAEANAVPLRLKAERFKELVAINAVSKQDYDDALAAVARSEAEIKSADAALSGTEAQIEGADASVKGAEADIQGADAAVQRAEAGIESAEAAVKSSEAEIEGAEAAAKAAEAEIQGAEAALETARINLAHTRVTAPISGRIGRSAVTTGALVTANQTTPLSTIQQLDSVFVDVTQSTANLLRLQQSLARGDLKAGGPNQAKVKLLLEDGSPYPLDGTLKFSDVTVDPSTGSVTLRTLFPNPKHALLPGMYVRAVLEEGVSAHALLVPQRGVTRNPAGNAMVMVVGAGEKVEPRVIKTERTVGDSWLVSEGLHTGDRVILEGIQKARPGTAVKAVPFVGKPDSAPAGAPQPVAAKT
jgi:membrane fusion protein (multidrug efflux system)